MDAIFPGEFNRTTRALLVGAAHYDHQEECPDLRTPAADVDALAGALQRPECGFIVRKLIDPLRTEFATEVSEMLGSAGREETILLYFSGHGKASASGLLLCTKDTKRTALQATSVRVGADIKDVLATTRAKIVILIFDCCYSGQAFGSFKGGDVGTHLWDELGRPEGKYLITSSSMTQPSVELTGDHNSLFTKWLVKGLETWEADRYSQGIIYLRDLFDYVKRRVENENPAQTPQYKGFETADVPVVIARRPHAAAMDISGPIPFLEIIRGAVDDNEAIFFLGDGIYRDGPLSSPRLIQSIANKMALKVPEETGFPTVAELYQRYLDNNRSRFLRDFRSILYEQEKYATALPAIHEMLVRLEPPWLVISTTQDLLLERHLESENIPFVVVAHILRDLIDDENTAPNGKILVMRRGPQPTNEIFTADDLPELNKDRVIYKLLGSPCFGDWVSPSEIDPASLDTVVVTEDDHVTLLGLLRNEKTRVPTAFSLPFRRKSAVLLGYNFDTWDYRLVTSVLKERMSTVPGRRLYAVRKAKSPIEDLLWERLRARLIPIDPETFIRRLDATRLKPSAAVEKSGADQLATTDAVVSPDPPSAYLGLKPYAENEQSLFFGREVEAKRLVDKIFSTKLTLFYGPSGVGKSSLLLAGVVPSLRDPKIGDALVVVFNGWHEMDVETAIKREIAEAIGPNAEAVGIKEPLTSWASLVSCAQSKPLVLILDQFEQFLLARTERPDPLRAELATLVRADLDVYVVISLREEFLAGLEVFAQDIVTIYDSKFRLGYLTDAGAEEAIVRAAARFGVPVEPALVAALKADLKQQDEAIVAAAPTAPGIELPLLQIVCKGLWDSSERGPGEPLSLALYTQLGQCHGIIQGYVERLTNALPPRIQEEATEILRWFAPTSGIKQSLEVGLLCELTRLTVERVEQVLRYFVTNYVLRERLTGSERWYEFYHDAYIWVLRPWIDERLAEKKQREERSGSRLARALSKMVRNR